MNGRVFEVHLRLTIVIVRQRNEDLANAEVRMLAVDFVRALVWYATRFKTTSTTSVCVLAI
jgi:hypothetical protein